MYKIYIITNLINNKQYIGKTGQTLKKRFEGHCYGNHNTLISKAIKEFGKENFKIEVLEEISGSNLIALQKEREYILRYNTLQPNGYNEMIGQSMYGCGNNKMGGKKLPPEWAAKTAHPGEKNGRACRFRLIWLDTNEELIFNLRQNLADYLKISVSTVKKWLGKKHIDYHTGRPVIFYNIGRIH